MNSSTCMAAPGATACTPTPAGPSSRARATVIPRTADLVALYAAIHFGTIEIGVGSDSRRTKRVVETKTGCHATAEASDGHADKPKCAMY